MSIQYRAVTGDVPRMPFALHDCPECVQSEESTGRNPQQDNPAPQNVLQSGSFQGEDTRDAWRHRLLSLSEQKQTEIAKKYYGGKFPWRENKRDQ